jgi:hypothetical protein
MTVKQLRKAWLKMAEQKGATVRIPITQSYEESPVIFPDGSPVRRVLLGFVGGRSVVIVSGERED